MAFVLIRMPIVCKKLQFVESNVESTLFEISGFRCRAFEIFSLL
jgi:hypothetical protein